jgi:2-polyprenyl-3-methyl-5-hydroxy-6-metoxy-1,4-benzoquinol methylase
MKRNLIVLARYRIVLDSLGNCRGQKVLDFGCGDGALSHLIARQGAMVTGVDSSESGIELARAITSTMSYPAESPSFHSEDILTYEPVRPFDRLVLCDVIEHLEDPLLQAILDRLEQMASGNAKMIMTTPKLDSNHGMQDSVNHCKEYTREELLQFLNSRYDDVRIFEYFPRKVFWKYTKSKPYAGLMNVRSLFHSSWLGQTEDGAQLGAICDMRVSRR